MAVYVPRFKFRLTTPKATVPFSGSGGPRLLYGQSGPAFLPSLLWYCGKMASWRWFLSSCSKTKPTKYSSPSPSPTVTPETANIWTVSTNTTVINSFTSIRKSSPTAPNNGTFTCSPSPPTIRPPKNTKQYSTKPCFPKSADPKSSQNQSFWSARESTLPRLLPPSPWKASSISWSITKTSDHTS